VEVHEPVLFPFTCSIQGGGGKKLRRAEEGANILGVFRVKNHYFTPKNHSFYNYGGRSEKFWGISCEKSRLYGTFKFLLMNPSD
jgi:hypothetical protein